VQRHPIIRSSHTSRGGAKQLSRVDEGLRLFTAGNCCRGLTDDSKEALSEATYDGNGRGGLETEVKGEKRGEIHDSTGTDLAGSPNNVERRVSTIVEEVQDSEGIVELNPSGSKSPHTHP